MNYNLLNDEDNQQNINNPICKNKSIAIISVQFIWLYIYNALFLSQCVTSLPTMALHLNLRFLTSKVYAYGVCSEEFLVYVKIKKQSVTFMV